MHQKKIIKLFKNYNYKKESQNCCFTKNNIKTEKIQFLCDGQGKLKQVRSQDAPNFFKKIQKVFITFQSIETKDLIVNKLFNEKNFDVQNIGKNDLEKVKNQINLD